MDQEIFAWEEEEADDDISVETEPVSVEKELEKFRHQWQQELHSEAVNSSEGVGHVTQIEEPSIEEQAKFLFLQGVRAEQNHKLYDAIRFYRRAVQLVPDIEFRIDEYKPRRRKDRLDSESSVGSSSESEVEDLIQHFTNLAANDNSSLCTPANEAKTGGHISQLPWEILVYIFKWVISTDLDIVSLERLTEVCRGFYVCGRDEELWKLICQKVYGLNCGRASLYGCYRNMYIQKPHLRFNGCYISRLAYYREGEKSLDGFYRPYHLVEYYRYIHFFPDGEVLMLTSPDSPHMALSNIRNRKCRTEGLLHGYYKMAGDQVTLLLKRRCVQEPMTSYYRYKSRRQNQTNNNESEQSFHVEFCLKNAGKRAYSQLGWNHYAITTVHKGSNQEQVAEFELTNSKYPPLIFSPVKSYTSFSDRPLM